MNKIILFINKIMLPPNFDWQFYICHYNDLIENNILTEQQAINHYITYGRGEKRIYNHNSTNDEHWWIFSDDIIYNNYTSTNNISDNYYTELNNFIKIYYPQENYNNVLNIINNDPKIGFKYFSFRYINYIRKFPIPVLTLNNYKEAVIVECRYFPHLEFTIRNTIRKLGNTWSYTVVCGISNYELIYNICNSISPNIKIIRMPILNLTWEKYSELFTNNDFWEQFAGEKILIYQDDACIFKENINDFIQYDYIGAEWPTWQIDKFGLLVGNGGLSLRSKSIMLQCINFAKQYNPKFFELAEDVFFIKIMHDYKIGNLAPVEAARLFSVEHVYAPDPLGGHNWWYAFPDWKSLLYKYVVQL